MNHHGFRHDVSRVAKVVMFRTRLKVQVPAEGHTAEKTMPPTSVRSSRGTECPMDGYVIVRLYGLVWWPSSRKGLSFPASARLITRKRLKASSYEREENKTTVAAALLWIFK